MWQWGRFIQAVFAKCAGSHFLSGRKAKNEKRKTTNLANAITDVKPLKESQKRETKTTNHLFTHIDNSFGFSFGPFDGLGFDQLDLGRDPEKFLDVSSYSAFDAL